MNKRVTIKDVAQKAGVTHTTVSRVIHNDHRISEPTRQRVQRALKALDYEPNLIARGLVRNKTQVVAVITPELWPHTVPIVRSIAENCSKRDYAMMLFPTNTWVRESLSFEHVVQNWLVDGVLVYNLIYHAQLPEEIVQFQTRNVPFVFINKFLDSSLVNAAGIDNDFAVDLAVEHLAGLGRKRIGTLHGNPTSVDGMERLRAFRNSMKRRGLALDEKLVACGLWYEDPSYREMQKMLDLP
ncbi:MAG: LacI family DNA-binding transcriptional regulator, partial [Kiritimatiellae bacterium]|nr:LacI family DNA-binding transcriptional regulator [Kiritimatiellia bacterium]